MASTTPLRTTRDLQDRIKRLQLAFEPARVKFDAEEKRSKSAREEILDSMKAREGETEEAKEERRRIKRLELNQIEIDGGAIKAAQEYLVELRILVHDLKETCLPLRLVGGATGSEIEDTLGKLESILKFDQYYEHLAADLRKIYMQLVNQVRLVQLKATAKRRAVVSGKRLLSLDGGGVRGVCSIMVLWALMKAVKYVEDNDDSYLSTHHWKLEKNWQDYKEDLPAPPDYFDLVGGTSTGGLIAIMLFRLGLGVREVMEKYKQLSGVIFPSIIWRQLRNWVKAVLNISMYNGSNLESKIRDIVHSALHQDEDAADAPMLAPHEPAHLTTPMFACAVTKRTKHAINFRTYEPRGSRSAYDMRCTIVEAARATSAAPFYFPPKEIEGVTFWDGGLQNNNPICQLLAELENLKDDGKPEIPAIVISLGTGRPLMEDTVDKEIRESAGYTALAGLEERSLWAAAAQVSALKEFVTHTENDHRSFERVLRNVDVDYHRLNPTIDDKEQPIGLDDCDRISDLEDMTNVYLRGEEVQRNLFQIARVLARRVPELDPLGDP